MLAYLRKQYENVDLTPGRGRGSAAISISLGSLSLLGSLCFLFPFVFTTPEVRKLYDVEFMKNILYLSIVIAFGFGIYSIFRHKDKRHGIIGVLLASGAAVLGFGPLDMSEVELPGIYFGLDYFILTLLILALVFIPLERAFPKNTEQKTLRKGWMTDVAYFAFSHLGIQLISFFTVIPVQIYLHDYVHVGFQQWVADQPVWLQFIGILVVVDFGTYWVHRAMHEIPALWKIHAIHHSSEHMDWLASSRLHVLEILANRFVGYLPIFLLGFSPTAVLAYLVFISFHAIFIHANVKFRVPVLRWLLATPEFHHWHHSSEQAAIDKNYAGFLPVYDVMFRTSYLPDLDAKTYGTVSDPVPEGMWGQFLYPFVGLMKRT